MTTRALAIVRDGSADKLQIAYLKAVTHLQSTTYSEVYVSQRKSNKGKR